MRTLLRGVTLPEVLVLALASAVGEEWLFRGVLQSWVGPVLATLLFAALHFPYRSGLLPWTLFALVLGAWMAWLQILFGTLMVPIFFHALVNAGNLAWIVSIPEE
jgi:membrane protease YdiL (CAAX protease family)